MTYHKEKGIRYQTDLTRLVQQLEKYNVMNKGNQQTQRQIADRYIAKKAIFDAMMNGRRISFLDSAEFEVSEMHTQMHCIRQDIEDIHLLVVLKDEWIEFGKHGKKCKRYWLEARS